MFNSDYRGLKVQLGIIRAQAPLQGDTSSSTGATDLGHVHNVAPHNDEIYDEPEGENAVEYGFCP